MTFLSETCWLADYGQATVRKKKKRVTHESAKKTKIILLFVIDEVFHFYSIIFIVMITFNKRIKLYVHRGSWNDKMIKSLTLFKPKILIAAEMCLLFDIYRYLCSRYLKRRQINARFK